MQGIFGTGIHKQSEMTLKTDIYSLGVIIIKIMMGLKLDERPNLDEVKSFKLPFQDTGNSF